MKLSQYSTRGSEGKTFAELKKNIFISLTIENWLSINMFVLVFTYKFVYIRDQEIKKMLCWIPFPDIDYLSPPFLSVYILICAMIFYIMSYYSFSQLLKYKKTIFQFFNIFFKVNEIRPIVNSSIEKDDIGDRSILWIGWYCG